MLTVLPHVSSVGMCGDFGHFCPKKGRIFHSTFESGVCVFLQEAIFFFIVIN